MSGLTNVLPQACLPIAVRIAVSARNEFPMAY